MSVSYQLRAGLIAKMRASALRRHRAANELDKRMLPVSASYLRHDMGKLLDMANGDTRVTLVNMNDEQRAKLLGRKVSDAVK